MAGAKVAAPVLAAALMACSPGAGSDDADADTPDPYEEIWAFYEIMRENVAGFAYADGQWDMDQGDGRFYGLAWHAHVGQEEGNAAYLAIASEARDYNVWLLEQAISDFSFFVDHFEEVIMATLGLIEYASLTGEDSFMPQVESIIDTANDLLALYGDYLDVTEVDSWALRLYGPTTITGAIALVDLQYATYMDTDLRQDRIDRAVEIVETIDATVLDGSRYLFRPGDADLYLYPNAMMIIVLLRLEELTGEHAYLDRAEGIFVAIQPLKYDDRPGYHSPYSQELMGATTDDYSTLSVHNYLSLGLMQLHVRTGEQLYLDEAVEILLFIRDYLYNPDDHLITHHWMDGAIAQPTHVEYFCSGCNLQFLYVVWYLRKQVL
jgi:hypothetical protein